jgi:hypothetical protein
MAERVRLVDSIALTLDLDWAPDFTINFVAERLIMRQVRATWFVTHLSPAIERLRRYPDLFELGIHPNFLPGSTHGDTPEAVLRHCMALVPEATSMRTHALFQSSPLLEQILIQTAITTDVSLFLPYTPSLRPVEYQWRGRTLLRIPFYWEDCFEMERAVPSWHLSPLLATAEGLKVFSFHPVHVYLNSSEIETYRALKKRIYRQSEATQADMNSYVQTGKGARMLFMELIEHITSGAIQQSLCMRDIYKRWQEEKAGTKEGSK